MTLRNQPTITEPGGLVGSPAFLAELAKLIAIAGKPDFYDAMSSLVADLMRCKQRLVMQYSAYDKPAFIINEALTEEGVDFYLGGLYRIDPLHKLARTNHGPTVINLRSLTQDLDENYLIELVKLSIFDELAILLPAYGGVTVAICCERRRQRFASEDHDIAQAILPVLDALNKLHMDRLFSNAGTLGRESFNESFKGGILVLDRRGEVAYANDAWNENRQAVSLLPGLAKRITEAGPQYLSLDENQIVHWERLPGDFSLAPDGNLLVIEHRSPGPLATTGKLALEAFCRSFDLTPREAEIVRLSFVGLPNLAIAKQLGVSVGTVKNHRWRLYYKLDITTERELFHLFLSTLLSLERSDAKAETLPVA